MYRVIKKDGRYYVKKDDATRASKSFDNAQEAEDYCNQKNEELGLKASKNVNESKKLKQRKKVYKKNKPLIIAIFVLLFLIGVAFGVTYLIWPDKLDNLFKSFNHKQDINHEFASGVVYDDFQIHFMMLGNDKAGDSIYIKAGDNDILIDAGSRKNSAEVIEKYVSEYCTDKQFEYVIATHGDQDHIDAFPRLLENYKAKNIIYNRYTTKETQTYKNMITAFQKQEASGATLYYADDFYKNVETVNLSDKVTMTLLYNKFYFGTEYVNEKGKTLNNNDENNFSVCTLFTYKSGSDAKYFMFTGDLEYEGERQMALYYDGKTPEKTLPQVDLFKAGHHGSKTSSNDCLLELIKPKMCVVSCCCGTNEYTAITDNQFPTQAFIDRISKYTDAVYVTSIYDSFEIATKTENDNAPGVNNGGNYIKSNGFKAMNGNICVSCGLKEEDGNYKIDIALACSNNDTKLKDTEWMNLSIIIDGVERKVRKMPKSWQ